MTSKRKQEKTGKEGLLREDVHIENEEERRILAALRDPVKGPLLYSLMNEKQHLPVSG